MADAVAVTAAAIALVTLTTNTTKAILRLSNRHDDVQQIQLDFEVSIHKFQVWQNNWSGQARQSDVTAKALWGAQGWAIIVAMLDKISRTSREIEELLHEIRENKDIQPRARWKTAVKSLRSRKQRNPKLQDLQLLASTLTKAVDELWMYSETIFDSLHGILAYDSRLPERDLLLKSALQSRAGSLQLYSLCSHQTENCSLEMDLLDAGMTWTNTQVQDDSSLRLYYHLMTQSQEKELQKLVIENVREIDVPEDELEGKAEVDFSDLQIFKPKPGQHTRIIRVAPIGSGPQSCLRIPEKPPETMLLTSDPESLAKVLKGIGDTNYLSIKHKEHFSNGAKVELAYKVIECGFFLLGTPWFSSLNSKNLRRLKSTGRQRPSFMLRTQTLDLKDLLLDDPGALAETSQLFRLGVILMEIALEVEDTSSGTEDQSQDFDRMSKLPLIEKSMGAQYCKATAFCLQSRPFMKDFRSDDKYTSTHFRKWESYLAGFLEDYHAQVFLRSVGTN